MYDHLDEQDLIIKSPLPYERPRKRMKLESE